jgi:DNA-binding response OmpR family regulator
MAESSVLLVEADALVRHPLAEYLRECGYDVLEACNAAEAYQILDNGSKSIDIVLADADSAGGDAFALARWLRTNRPAVNVILAGTVNKALATAEGLCEDGPALTKPYSHQVVLDRIRRLRAARERNS